MAEIAVSVASRVSEYVVLPITRPVHYLCYYKSNLENLKKEVWKLNAERERLQHSIEAARRNGEEISRDVEYWLIAVEEFIHEALVVTEENELLSNRCRKGWCSNLKKRYRFSRKAERMLEVVIELLAEGRFTKVSYRTIQEEPWLQSKNNYMVFESRMSTLDNILSTLCSTDVNIIGVYGIAGIGKTSLVKQVALRANADKLFDVVIFVEVSETPDIKMIQGVIADNLGLKFQEESSSGRAARLYERLNREKNILLILDNIWGILDLESIGIPCGDNHSGCKILLSARSIQVLCEMDSKMNFSVDILNEEEAWILFKKIAGDFVEQHDLHSMAIDIAGDCGGVPIAIVTIARGLRNKGVDEWTNVFRDLKTARIQYTYDSLKSEELKKTFLLLSMMGHTYDASIGDLLKCGMSLDLFQNTDTMEEARTYAAKLVQKLKDYALLLGTPNSERFSMDNLVREVARSIALRDRHMFSVTDDFVLSDWEDKYRLENGIAVSFLDIRQLPKELEFPQLRFFYMKPSDPFLEIPEFFFAGMPELRVLHLIEMDLLTQPTSLHFLLNLQTLCLDQCKLGDVVVIGELKKLEILSFRSSDIEMLPNEIGRLTRLRLLDLSHCSKLKVISPNVFSNLTRLEELYMGNTSIQWEDERKLLHLSHSSKLKVIPPDAISTLTQPEELRIGNTSIQWEVERRNTSLYELMLLHHLTTLELHVREAGLMPEDLFFKKLERYKIVIGDCNWYEKYETARTLKLKLNTSIHFKEGFLMRLKGIENLCLDEMPGIRNVLSELDRNGFPELKHLEVQNNSYFLNIVESMQSVSCDVFPLLESLFISNLINLEKICDGPLKIMDFHRLRILEVQKCDKLKNILSFSAAESLLQLQEIKVTYCKNMEEIFAIVSKEGGNNEMIDKVQANQLRSMTLEYLPKLTSFCSRAKTPSLLQRRPSLLQRRQKAADARAKGIILEEEIDIPTLLFNENVMFPNLEALRLSAINVEKIWHNQFQAMCSWAPKLITLDHSRLCLRRFCSGNSIEFPSLKELEIENCPELESSIFSNKVELPSLEKIIKVLTSDLSCYITKEGQFDIPTQLPLFLIEKGFVIFEELELSGKAITMITWQDMVPESFFGFLHSLVLNDDKSTVLAFDIIQRFHNLKKLCLNHGSYKEIFSYVDAEEHVRRPLQIKHLVLNGLNELKEIWKQDSEAHLEFRNLEILEVRSCFSLSNLMPSSASFLNLKSLEVWGCEGLTNLVTSAIAKTWCNLRNWKYLTAKG
ncbi:hypothetical protein LWI28_026023 [Acer negundo]|uniref:AAA+ ATPase domain-containing protein n=1 Tax=Acer negundo TaxID=4023 RepID=A0AAD5P374_ACENE|nr:hypothetical protein LWI28_026023 [Acer negundo]